jgi:anti-anti-sigma factor
MGVSAHESLDGTTLTIRLPTRFDFGCFSAFLRAYRDKPVYNIYVLNLRDVHYMDSAALGMILQLQEFAGKSPNCVRVEGLLPEIADIFHITRFDEIMQVG